VNFSELQSFVYELGAQVSPSAFHGFVSGRVTCDPLSIDRLQEVSKKWLALSQDWTSEHEDQFTRFILSVLKNIEDPDFIFIPILPEEGIPLSERLNALGEWCGNYVSGFAEGLRKDFRLTDDASEALEDLSSIAKISLEFDENGERDYVELIEYIRVAVQLIYADLNSTTKRLH